ncbi:hypothetical protein HQ393_04975 [Chitinibacter bivalviorum]|uniref:Uncharacterized protein n=1 Tax=Chitinibacter bivalviorum TaxID=2739434 RepID=A0A7H9BGD2_9NEIS|nr:hypothetical protein [Chitinibacter bivalviorum]QLG87657.1 hypothetical protein HQ393_04975 [Chitinibacter bivalviorum]
MNAPSTEFAQPLAAAWVERIFMRLHGRFGNPFLDKFRAGQLASDGEDIGVKNAKMVWGEELAGLSADDLRLGLTAKFNFPPSCDEFLAACRPASTLNVDALLYVAIDCMSARRSRMPENWPDARTFWAAVNIGNDLLLLPAEKLKSRWAASYQRAEDRANDPIPPAVKPESSLPAPGKTTISREEAAKRTETLSAAAKVGRPAATMYTRWAHDIAEKPEGLPMVTLEKAVKAFVAWGQQIPERLVAHVCERGLQKLLPEGV